MHLYNLWKPEMNQSFANKYMKTKYMIIWKLELWVNSQRIPLTHTNNYLSCYLLDWDNLPYVEYNFVKFHQYQFIHIKELQEIQEIFTEQSDPYINANMFKERFVVTMREGVKRAFTTYGHQSLSCLCRSNCSTHNLMPSCFIVKFQEWAEDIFHRLTADTDLSIKELTTKSFTYSIVWHVNAEVILETLEFRALLQAKVELSTKWNVSKYSNMCPLYVNICPSVLKSCVLSTWIDVIST